MDIVEGYTGIPAPYKNLPPHITFHKPIKNISEETMRNLTKSMSLQMNISSIHLSCNLTPFGKHYIVLRAHPTITISTFWIGINDLLSKLPEYEHGPFDKQNTLHVSISSKTSDIFDEAWPKCQSLMLTEELAIFVNRMLLYRKLIDGGIWEKVEEYPFPV